jgi:hypothetical protein
VTSGEAAPPRHVSVDRVVVEVPDLSHATPPWRWFELDLDQASDDSLAIRLPPALTGIAKVSGMTRAGSPSTVQARIARAADASLTHIQFEAGSPGARHAARLIRASGLTPMPAIHLGRQPAAASELLRSLDTMVELGAPLVKLAYPAPDRDSIEWGLSLLAQSRRLYPGTELALIPMGTRAGRAAALAAGSRLLWAPLQPDGERWAASLLQARLSPAQPQPGEDSR